MLLYTGRVFEEGVKMNYNRENKKGNFILYTMIKLKDTQRIMVYSDISHIIDNINTILYEDFLFLITISIMFFYKHSICRTLQELVEHYSKDSDGLCVNLCKPCVQVKQLSIHLHIFNLIHILTLSKFITYSSPI